MRAKGPAARANLRGGRRGPLGDARPGLLVLPLNVGLEFGCLDAPLAATTHTDGRQFAAVEQGQNLTRRDVEDLRDVGDDEETRCHAASLACAYEPGPPLSTGLKERQHP